MFLSGGKKLPFVGREKEISFLGEEFNATSDYAGRFVLVRGETGTGKTRLLHEFLSLPALQTAWRLAARAVENETSILAPFPNLVSDCIARIPNKTEFLAKYLEPYAVHPLSEIIPGLKDNYPFEIPFVERREDHRLFFNGLFKFFANLSLARPVIIAIDDIHWLPEESLEFLKFLALRIHDKPILIIGSSHPVGPDSNFDQVRSALAEQRALRSIDLPNLTWSDVDELLESLFGPDVPLPFRRWLHQTTNGNPLFIEEIIRALTERNILRFQETRWEIVDYYQDLPLTESLRAMIKTRLGRLRPEQREFLETASVLGSEFELDTLLKFFPIPGPANSKILHRLLAMQLLEPREKLYAFTHPLFREVIYNQMEPLKRKNQHRAIARYLEKNRGSEEAIAYHLTKDLASEEETKSLCRRLLKLTSALVKKYKGEDAYRYASRALEIARKFPNELTQENLRAEFIIHRLGPITGKFFPRPEEDLALVKRLERRGYLREAAQILLFLSRSFSYRLNFEQAEHYRNWALRLLRRLKHPARERLFWMTKAEECTLLRRKGDYRRAKSKAAALLSTLPPQFFPYPAHIATTTLGVIAELEGNLEKSFQYYEQSLKIAEEGLRLDGMAVSYTNLGIAYQVQGKLNEALANFRKALDINTTIGDAGAALNTRYHIGETFLSLGELDRAISALSQTIEESVKFNYYNLVVSSLAARAKAAFYQDRIDDARKDLALIQSMNTERKVDENTLCAARLVESRIELEYGNYPEALKGTNRVSRETARKNLTKLQWTSLIQRCLILAKLNKKNQALKLANPVMERIEDPMLFTELGIALHDEAIIKKGILLLVKMGAQPWVSYIIRKLEKNEPAIVGRGGTPGAGLVKFAKALARTEPARSKVFTLGGLKVIRPADDDPVPAKDWGSKKAKELLGLLIVLGAGAGATRETLSSHLWPRMSPDKSRLNFNFTMSQLRKALGMDCINFDGTFYKLDAEKVWVDCFEFGSLYTQYQALQNQGKLHPAEAKARAAWLLYQGDFLPEMYELPIDDHQIELRAKVKSILEWLAVRSRERLDWDELIDFGQQLLRLEPLNEFAHYLIMESLVAKGDRAGALRQFERLREMMQQELKVTPGSDITNLYNNIIR